jgi:hypothetical protein
MGLEFKGYGAGVEIYEKGGQYVDEHGYPVEQAQLRYGLDVTPAATSYGKAFVYTSAGYDHPQFAPDALIKQAIPETERENVTCGYCGNVDIRPAGIKHVVPCMSCGGM